VGGDFYKWREADIPEADFVQGKERIHSSSLTQYAWVIACDTIRNKV
jgi:hypothetical protein